MTTLPGMRRCDLRHSNVSGAKVVQRAAYQSDERLYDAARGRTWAYPQHEERITWKAVLLPRGAPAEWEHNRAAMWSAAAEKAGYGGRAAHRFILPIPNEASHEEAIKAVREFCRPMVVAGCCCDAAIHAKPGNLHAHVLVSDAPIDPKTSDFGQKSQKAYLVRRGDEEAWMTSGELKAANKAADEGDWEKVYKYVPAGHDTKDKAAQARMTAAEAAKGDWKRVTKQPVAKMITFTGFSRREQIKEWRVAWEKQCNVITAVHGTQAVSEKSYAELGLDRARIEPTRHEGYGRDLAAENAETVAARDTMIAAAEERVAALRLRDQIRQFMAQATEKVRTAQRAARRRWQQAWKAMDGRDRQDAYWTRKHARGQAPQRQKPRAHQSDHYQHCQHERTSTHVRGDRDER